MMPLTIRPALAEDASTIATIFNDVILTTTAIYEDTLRSKEDIESWLKIRQENGAVFVAEDKGQIVGMCFYGPFRAASGYRSTVEHGLHLTPLARGKGFGKEMMQFLIDHAREKKYHALIGAIDAGNTTSLKLHEKFGFTQVGLLPQVARKFGRWLDLSLMQLILD